MWSQCSSYLEPHWEERCAAFVFSLSGCFSVSAFVIFLLLSHYPPFSPTVTIIITVWRVARCHCVGAHDWVWGIASHGSILLSRGRLITVEAPGHPRHPPSTQLDAFVNIILLLLLLVYSLRQENFFSVGYVKFMCLNYCGMKPLRHCLKSKQHHHCPTNALIRATLSLNVGTTMPYYSLASIVLFWRTGRLCWVSWVWKLWWQ